MLWTIEKRKGHVKCMVSLNVSRGLPERDEIAQNPVSHSQRFTCVLLTFTKPFLQPPCSGAFTHSLALILIITLGGGNLNFADKGGNWAMEQSHTKSGDRD